MSSFGAFAILQILIFIDTAHTTPSPITTTSNYHYVPLQKTWTEAEKYCNDEFGTNLASIHNADQNQRVSNLCKNNAVSPYKWCWIGLNDIDNERYEDKTGWTWSDGSTFYYDSWSAAQPDSSNVLEDCVEINWAGSYGFWNDVDCYNLNAFVCNRYNPATIISTVDPTNSPTSLPTVAPSFAPKLNPAEPTNFSVMQDLLNQSSEPTLEPTAEPTVDSPDQNRESANHSLTGVILLVCYAILVICCLGALIFAMGQSKKTAEETPKTGESVNHLSATLQKAEMEIAKAEVVEVADSSPAMISKSYEDEESLESLYLMSPMEQDNMDETTTQNDGEEGGSNGYERIEQILKLIYNDDYEEYLRRFRDEMIDDFKLFEDTDFRSSVDEKDEFWEKIMPQRGARIDFFRYVNRQFLNADV